MRKLINVIGLIILLPFFIALGWWGFLFWCLITWTVNKQLQKADEEEVLRTASLIRARRTLEDKD